MPEKLRERNIKISSMRKEKEEKLNKLIGWKIQQLSFMGRLALLTRGEFDARGGKSDSKQGGGLFTSMQLYKHQPKLWLRMIPPRQTKNEASKKVFNDNKEKG